MFFLSLLAAMQLASPAEPATSAPPVAAETSVAAPAVRLISAGTIIDLEFAEPASSKTSRSGMMINLRTAEEVRGTRNELLIPKGSRVVAEVIQASPGRMMGKAGELTLAARFVEVDGMQIPLKRFRFGPSSGKDNNGTVFVATALIGLPGLLISGGNIDIAPGARANAVVVGDTSLPAPVPVSTEGGK